MTLGLASCQDGDWDKEITSYEIGNKSIEDIAEKQISVAELKAKYKKTIESKNGSYELINEDLQLKCKVVTNDKEGNLSQQLVVTDGEQNIIIGITDDDMWSYLPVGQEIIVQLKGLYIGGYGQNAQIGAPSMKYDDPDEQEKDDYEPTTRIGRMTRYTWYEHFVKTDVCTPEIGDKYIDFMNKNMDYDADANKLVEVFGTIAIADGTKKIADPYDVTDTSNCVNIIFTMTNGKTVTLRTSTYSDFGSMSIPQGKVRLRGIAVPYKKSSWQIQMRYGSDLVSIE